MSKLKSMLLELEPEENEEELVDQFVAPEVDYRSFRPWIRNLRVHDSAVADKLLAAGLRSPYARELNRDYTMAGILRASGRHFTFEVGIARRPGCRKRRPSGELTARLFVFTTVPLYGLRRPGLFVDWRGEDVLRLLPTLPLLLENLWAYNLLRSSKMKRKVEEVWPSLTNEFELTYFPTTYQDWYAESPLSEPKADMKNLKWLNDDEESQEEEA